MKMAIDEATKGIDAVDGGPFGAVIVKGDQVLAFSHNMVLKNNDPTSHAEMNVISLAARDLGTFDLSGCEIYSTTEPCPMCFSAIHWARVDVVVYGTEIEDVKKLGFNELSISAAEMKASGMSPVVIKGGFMKEDCEKLLQYWAKSPTKKVY